MAFVRTSLLLFYFVVIAFYYEASALGILSTTEFQEGQTVKVTCSADAVDLDNAEQVIYTLEISRRTYSSNIVESIYKLENVQLLIGDTYLFQNLPAQRQWVVEESPTEDELRNQKFKRSMMKAVLAIKDTNCDDSGEYFCKVVYRRDGNNFEVEEKEMLNSTVVSSSMAVNVFPVYAVDGEFEAVYKINETITMSCKAEGPQEYKFFWKRSCPNAFQPTALFLHYPYQNDIKEHKNEAILNSKCGVHRHSQELIFEMSREMENCMIQCDFGEVDRASDNVMANFTFRLEKAVPPGKSSSASSASNTDLVIGLTVSFLLVAIIVAAVLLYVCWWRKRKPIQDKHKDEPDVGHGDSHDHAPPPVFYSKPNKPPKNDARGDHKEEEKWNSKDHNASYDYDDDDELPPKAYYNDLEEGDKSRNDDNPPKQIYNSNRPRGRRRSQRGSGDYYHYDNNEEGYPENKSRNRSYGDGSTPYATVNDYSRSEDESESGHSRPKPKRRTKLPSTSSRDFEDPPKEKELHYADLDLSRKTPQGDGTYNDEDQHPGRYNRNRRNRKSRGHEDEEENMPVQYASIRV